MKTRVTGVGGIFFKSDDPDRLYQWYAQHLGFNRAPDGTGAAFEWRDAEDADKKGMTVWSIFPRNTKYFEPSSSPFMINYRVDDLDALLETLKKEGVQIDPHREDYDYGRFAWIMDPDGNRIELWEPPKGE
jgi:predicted enzyme related to lactoylglutathione lyase